MTKQNKEEALMVISPTTSMMTMNNDVAGSLGVKGLAGQVRLDDVLQEPGHSELQVVAIYLEEVESARRVQLRQTEPVLWHTTHRDTRA
jgi:hypothetical protein